MSDQVEDSRNLYKQLAQLAQANVTGSLGQKIISQAQRKLVDRLVESGVVAEEDKRYLKM